MKQKSLLILALATLASFLMVGCSGSSDPEVDKNVPMAGKNEPFKPTSATGAAGSGNSPGGASLGTPSAQ